MLPVDRHVLQGVKRRKGSGTMPCKESLGTETRVGGPAEDGGEPWARAVGPSGKAGAARKRVEWFWGTELCPCG